MSDGFPLLTTKKLHFKSIVTELLWFLRGDTNIRYLVDNGNTIWVGDAYKAYTDKFVGYDDVPSKEWFIEEIKRNPEFAQKFGNLGPIYGKQWRKWKTFRTTSYTNPSKPTDSVEYIDQIANLINDLKTNPDSRRLMVNAWNVGELDSMVLPPCHYSFQVYTRELSLEERRKLANHDSQFISPITVESWDRANIPTRAISLMWNQRSVDTFLGLPFNIASYGLLLEIIAKEVNMVPDELIGNLGDTHLYLNHVEQAREQISREPYPLPKLILDDWYSTQGDPSNTPKDISEFLKNIHVSHVKIEKYQSHPSIKAPLSN
jgi:thymidylate synthase